MSSVEFKIVSSFCRSPHGSQRAAGELNHSPSTRSTHPQRRRLRNLLFTSIGCAGPAAGAAEAVQCVTPAAVISQALVAGERAAAAPVKGAEDTASVVVTTTPLRLSRSTVSLTVRRRSPLRLRQIPLRVVM
jgi:hypothetical protein